MLAVFRVYVAPLVNQLYRYQTILNDCVRFKLTQAKAFRKLLLEQQNKNKQKSNAQKESRI